MCDNETASSQEATQMGISKRLYKTSDRSQEGSVYRHRHNTQVNFECLLKMFNNGLHCDIVLKCDGGELSAHKVILASCSTFLYAKFSMNRKLKHLELKHVTYDALAAIVKYFYTSEVRLTAGNVEELLEAASNLVIPDLQEACWGFLQDNLSSNTCVQTAKIAKRLKSELLASAASAFMAQHLSQVIADEEYLKLDKDEIQDLISRNESCSAQDLLGSLVRWVRFDSQQRKEHLLSLIEYVSLSSVPLESILQTIEQESWLKSDPELILKFVKTHNMETPLKLADNKAQPSKLLIVVGFDRCSNLTIEIYDFEGHVWQELHLPEKLQICSEELRVVIYDTTIYCIHNNFMHALDLSKNPTHSTWAQSDQMLKKNRWYGMSVLENSVYVAGGKRKDKKLAMAQRFDISERKWSSIAHMSAKRDSMTLGAMAGYLYVVGGDTDSFHYTKAVERYNPRTDSWETLPMMTVGRWDPGVGCLGNNLFVVGGCNEDGDCKVVEAYDSVSRTWSRLADLVVARQGPGVIGVDGSLFVIGGIFEKSVEVYDADSKTWTLMPELMNTDKGLVAVSLVDKSRLKVWEATRRK